MQEKPENPSGLTQFLQPDTPDLVVASIRDITKEHESQAQLVHARETAESQSIELEQGHQRLEAAWAELHQERELRDNFVAGLSHDLRTPLSVAMFSSQQMLREVEPTSPVYKRAERILTCIKRIDLMIRDLLDVNRLQAGHGLSLIKKECALHSIVEEACDSLFDMSGNRIVKKVVETAIILGCSNSLTRVIENLIDNAMKYGSPETPVTVSLTCDNGFARVAVHNFGEPISRDDGYLLFEPYRRAPRVVKSEVKGWGLGLAVVKGIVEAHSGHVTVDSSSEGGTSFIIALPLISV